MDNYEKLLEEKIENAKKDLNGIDKRYDLQIKMTAQQYNVEKGRLRGEIEAYQDALNEYRQFKAKDDKEEENEK